VKLDSDFEAKATEAFLPDDEQAEALGNQMVDIAEKKWRAYMSVNDYDLEHIVQDVRGPMVEQNGNSVSIRVEWPFSAMFEFGVDPHVIEAKDASVLAFPWPEMEGEEFGDTGKNFEEVFADTWPVVFLPKVNWGSRTGGIPKARAVRDMLLELRGELQS